MVDRPQGYVRGIPKEEGGLRLAEAFFQHFIGCKGARIVEAERNYTDGDLRFPSGSVECKRQPIDPTRHSQNFVEVFEVTRNDRHRGGLVDTARLLDLDLGQLVAARVKDCRPQGGQNVVGQPRCVSVSIRSISGSLFTVYANPAEGWIYLYPSVTLIAMIRHAVLHGGFVRGAGNSNDDTFAVFVPVADARWQQAKGVWAYRGEGSESRLISTVSEALVG